MVEELPTLTAEKQTELDQTGHVTINGRRRRVPLGLKDVPESPVLLSLSFAPDAKHTTFAYGAVSIVGGVVVSARKHYLLTQKQAGDAWQDALLDGAALFKETGYAAVDAFRYVGGQQREYARVGRFETKDDEPGFLFEPDIIAPPGPFHASVKTPQSKLSKPQVEAILDALLTEGPASGVDTLQTVAPAFFAAVDAQAVASGNPSWDETKAARRAVDQWKQENGLPVAPYPNEELDADREASWKPGYPDAPNADEVSEVVEEAPDLDRVDFDSDEAYERAERIRLYGRDNETV